MFGGKMYNSISVIPRVYKPAEVYDYSLDVILDWVRCGVCPYVNLKEMTAKIRAANTQEQLKEMKKLNLPVALFNGVFSYKASGFLTQYSNFTALDFDHFKSEEDLQGIKRRLMKTPCIYAVYRTPSGSGLKAIVMHDNDNPDYHEELYCQLLKKFQISTIDSSGSDLARGNYLCFDPDLWISENCQPYHFVHNNAFLPLQRTASRNQLAPDINQLRTMLSPVVVERNKSDQSIISILNAYWKKISGKWKEGNRANSVFTCASELCNAGVNIDLALEYLKKEYAAVGLGEDEIQYQTLRGYQMNAEGYGKNRSRFDSYGRGSR